MIAYNSLSCSIRPAISSETRPQTKTRRRASPATRAAAIREILACGNVLDTYVRLRAGTLAHNGLPQGPSGSNLSSTGPTKKRERMRQRSSGPKCQKFRRAAKSRLGTACPERAERGRCSLAAWPCAMPCPRRPAPAPPRTGSAPRWRWECAARRRSSQSDPA
jgi:hypothetical protein